MVVVVVVLVVVVVYPQDSCNCSSKCNEFFVHEISASLNVFHVTS